MPTMPFPSLPRRTPMSRRTKRLLKGLALGSATALMVVGIVAAIVMKGPAIQQALNPVDPTIAALVNPMLDQALPADLDRFSISGDLSTLADCEGHVMETARSRYGDALRTIGGNVQSYEHRDFSLPIEAERTASGHWAITSRGFGLRDARPADVQTQIITCATSLANRLDNALANNVRRNRNASAWSRP